MHFATFCWFGEQKFKFVFPSGATARAPSWRDDEFPPLSPHAAGRFALAFLDEVLPKSTAYLMSYTLAKAWGPQTEDCYWYYSIECQVPDPEDIAADHSIVHIPVLLNGVVPQCIALDAGESRSERGE